MPAKNIKGQSAIEFFILISFVLFIFLGLVYTVQQNIGNKIKIGKNIEVKEIALAVQEEINFASATTDGYYREFELPQKVVSMDYDINITNGQVYIRTQDGKFALALQVLNVTGEIKKGTNTIRKENEHVFLNS